MYEVLYATTRVARVKAADREDAKRRFAAYVLYDEDDAIDSDVQLSFGDDAEVAPFEGDAPVAAPRAELRDWLANRDAQSEPFEVGVFEDPERSIEAYLRLLATNDPWRLEGHGSLGITLSAIPIAARLVTFDGRVSYRFDAARYLDYLRLDVLTALDPSRLQESIRVESLVDVCALRDEVLRQIASAYATIASELRLVAKITDTLRVDRAFDVTFDAESWHQYMTHRLAEPGRFLPPPGWRSAYQTYD